MFKATPTYSMENRKMFITGDEARIWEEVMLVYCQALPRKRPARLGGYKESFKDNRSRSEPQTTKHNLRVTY
jgi:hypothetical protein